MIGKVNHIRYAQLDKLLSGQFSKDDKVNLFINLEHLIRPLLGKNYKKYLQTRKDDRIKELISDILNIAAHYRKFLSGNGIYSKVYLYMGDTRSSKYLNTMFYRQYRIPYYERFNRSDAKGIQGMIEEALRMVKIITNYIDGVYLIETTVIEPSLVPLHISKNNPEYKNVLLTNDLYEYQYAAYNNFIILRAKLEESHIVTKENVIERMKISMKITKEGLIGSNLTTLLLSGFSDKYRGIEVPKGFTPNKWYGTIQSLIKEKYISNEAMLNVNNTILSIVPSDILPDEIKDSIKINNKVTDINYQGSIIKMEKVIDKDIVDKFDNVSLKEVANMFTEYPINLMELQDFDPSKTKRNIVWE